MESSPATANARAARIGRRVAEGALLLLAIWFGASSTWQITVSALCSPPAAADLEPSPAPTNPND